MRSVDQIVRDTIGNLNLEIVKLTAQVEALQAELNKKNADPAPDTTV
jgi:uncharacterized small protein (DUF1192 family)